MRVLHFVHTDDSGPFRVGSFHLQREFLELGVDYRSVMPWRGFWGRFPPPKHPSSVHSIRAVGILPSKLYRFRPLWKLVLWINSTFFFVFLCLLLKRARWWPQVILVDSMYFFATARIFKFFGVKVIARMTDFLWDLDQTLSKSDAREWSFAFLKRVDHVITTNSELNTFLVSELGRPVSCIPNGVDYEHFSKFPLKTDGGNKTIRLVYFGAVDDRVNYDLLYQLSSIDGVFLTVIGNSSTKLKLGNNGFYAGEIHYDKLPETLQNEVVGILPFVNNDANRGRFPMKFFEYAAAGLLIISYPFQGVMSEVKNEDGVFYAVDFELDSFISCLDRIRAVVPEDDRLVRTQLSLRQLASANSWRHRAIRYLELIGDEIRKSNIHSDA